MTYNDVKAAYERYGLVDITPERCRDKATRHFLDPRVSDMLGLEGTRFRVYYVFNPTSGKFRRRIEYIWVNERYGKMRNETAYALNRRKTVTDDYGKHRVFILEHDIVKQMQLAAPAIEAYRKARKVD